MFKTLVMDFDGTIANTEKAILTAIKETLKILNCHLMDERELRQWIGMPLADIFRKAGVYKEEREAIRIYRNHFTNDCLKFVELYPGVADTLSRMASGGINLTIASNRGRESLDYLLEYLNIKQYFLLVVGEGDGLNAKPDPAMVNYIIEYAKSRKDETLVIGDTIYDINMGKAAHVKTCAVSYGIQPEALLAEAAPDYMIDNFSELNVIVTI